MPNPNKALLMVAPGTKARKEADLRAYLPFNGEGWEILLKVVADYEAASAAVMSEAFDLLFADDVASEIKTAFEPLVLLPRAELMNEHVIEAARAWAEARWLFQMRQQHAETPAFYGRMAAVMARLAAAAENIRRCRDEEPDDQGLAWLYHNLEDEIYKICGSSLFTHAYPIRVQFLGVPDVLRVDRYVRLVLSPAAWDHVIASAMDAQYAVMILDRVGRHAKLIRGDELYHVYGI